LASTQNGKKKFVSAIEIYTKWRVKPERMASFLQTAHDLVARTLTNDPGTLRCDWFVNDDRYEVISMVVHRDTEALAAHVASCGALYGQLIGNAGFDLQWVGRPSATALAALPVTNRIAAFDSGRQADSGSAGFHRNISAAPLSHIEIFTQFAIHPGKLAEFRQYAKQCLDRVCQSDPGTSRYDWFYDEPNQTCLALDTYNDPASMFAHMKNCHEPHARLLELSTMTTEFLGDLPHYARAAIAKYNPYIARFFAGLKGYSSGGFC
jgi:quinol monooxygenase YgiN